jgi:branched-chain amino acid transport system substrate-binding protein
MSRILHFKKMSAISKILVITIIIVVIVGVIAGVYVYTTITRPAPVEPLRIGVVLPFTGPYAAEAKWQYDGIQLAVKEINEKGGVLGHLVEVYTRDDELKPEVARRKVEELVEGPPKVHVLLGHLSAAIALMTNEYAKEKKIWFFALSMQTEKFNFKNVTGPYSFRYFMSTPECAVLASSYAFTKLGVKRIYILLADYAYGWSLRDHWLRMAKEHGVTVVGVDAAPLGTVDFSPYITKILAEKPDAVAVLNFGADFVNFVKQAYEYGVQKMGIKIFTASTTIPMAKGAGAEAMRDVYGCTQYYYEVENMIPEAAEFNKRFISYYGYPPDAYAEAAYSITKIVLEAIEKSGEWPLNLDKIKQIISKEKFITAKGTIFYDEAGNVHQPFILIRGKDPAKITTPYDLFEIVFVSKTEEASKYIPPPSYYGY